MSVDDLSGYKQVTKQYDSNRWQHRLFAEIRTAPGYRQVFDRLRASWGADGRPGERSGSFTDPEYWIRSTLDHSSTYYHALEQAAIDVGLTKDGKPATWAVEYLHDDVLEAFDPDRLPNMVSQVSTRLIEISISPAGSMVDTFRGWNSPIDEVRASQAQHQSPMMIGKAEWEVLERMAVEAAQAAVADLRSSYGHALHPQRDATKRIKGALESKRKTEFKNLANRLMKRARDRNQKHVDRRWCRDVGIDVPAWP